MKRMTDKIHCLDCKHWSGKKISGWCKNPKFPKAVRTDFVDFCDDGEKKE